MKGGSHEEGMVEWNGMEWNGAMDELEAIVGKLRWCGTCKAE